MAKKRASRGRPSSGKLFAEPQGDFFEKSAEEAAEETAKGKVECLGRTFENDEARRAYFLSPLQSARYHRGPSL